ncbi:hypothetical protein AB0I98_45210 [Streptomyces sp. NPDC050211]|uniref:hypothetical protein n=1 Tax=Streptomyces sp. NPDC050211 TaxID=3154932 RepID=UPI003434EEFB
MRPFPADLARTQQEWSAIYRQLAEQPGRTELRRRQRRPSAAEWWELRDLGRPDGDVC